MRRSLAVNLKTSASQVPSAAPICEMGPSRPALPPVAMVSTEVRPLMSAASGRMRPAMLWKALIMVSVPSVPPPMVSGMKRTTSQPVNRPTLVVIMGMSQGR